MFDGNRSCGNKTPTLQLSSFASARVTLARDQLPQKTSINVCCVIAAKRSPNMNIKSECARVYSFISHTYHSCFVHRKKTSKVYYSVNLDWSTYLRKWEPKNWVCWSHIVSCISYIRKSTDNVHSSNYNRGAKARSIQRHSDQANEMMICNLIAFIVGIVAEVFIAFYNLVVAIIRRHRCHYWILERKR